MKKGSKAIRVIFNAFGKIQRGLHRYFIEPIICKRFASYGESVRIGRGCAFSGAENIQIGNHVSFGADARVLTTRAQLKIGNYVMFAPGVTIITGDHRVDVIGKYMSQIMDADKRPEDDRDVVIEDDVWVGANVTILKGVTIGKGSVIAAGAVVTQSCPPYSVIGGVPARFLKSRLTPEQIVEHEKMLTQT